MSKSRIGLLGLAVMGQNLARNIARFATVTVYNRTTERTKEFLAGPAQGAAIRGAETLEELVGSLERPRTLILMVQAGRPVDAVLAQLRPLLTAGDIVVDGGNSFYQDTIRRGTELAPAGLHYVGMGVSGGEEGALNGPSLMPGGPRAAYDHLAPILTKIAAQTDDDGACVSYIGEGGGGHYVKMIHNGIEYGNMQLIAEVYELLRRLEGRTAPEIGAVFAQWNETELQSYLVEITATVLRYTDPETQQPLVDLILDTSGQKGTGRWTSQDALDLGVPIPTIDAAVWSRNISARKDERVRAAQVLGGPPSEGMAAAGSDFTEQVRAALYAAKIITYAQGMKLLREASQEYGFGLNLAEVARIWKGGCIIRAALLDQIKAAFLDTPDLTSLLLHPPLTAQVTARIGALRQVVALARGQGIPCPALSASLDYYESYRQERLPANLIQAQRDYFGAHTYQRTDKPGIFHTEWQTTE